MKSSKGFLEAEITRRFSERIAESLARKPIELQPGAHRERLKGLMKNLGEMSFYELLSVTPGASEEEIHAAYSELARLVHPSHAEPLGMRTELGGLELLFERATEAYLTLNDPDRSRIYQMATGIAPASSSRPTAERRREEQVDQAERLFRLARTAVGESRYFDAVQTLRQATRLDPKADYFALLGECLSQNPNWVKEAIAAYEAAVELSEHDPHLRTALALQLERAGAATRARQQYKAALALDPDFLDAQSGLDRLKARPDAAENEEVGTWGRIKRWLGSSGSRERSG